MNNWILLTMILASATAHAGREKAGNGGSIEEMRKYFEKVLSEADYQELLDLNAYKLKKNLLIPMFKAARTDALEDPVAKGNLYKIQADFTKLIDDLTYSKIKFGICTDGRDACVDKNAPFATITLNKTKLLAHKTTLAELGGLIAHEYEHKYASDTVEHDKYALSQYFIQRIKNKSYFTQIYMFRLPAVNLSNALAMKVSFLRAYKDQNHLFCIVNGFDLATDWDISNYEYFNGSVPYYQYASDGSIHLNMADYHGVHLNYYTKIECGFEN